MADEPTGSSSDAGDYEPSDVSETLAVSLALGFAAAVLIIPFILRAAYPQAYDGDISVAYQPAGPGPHLQLDETADLAALRSAEDRLLQSYGWDDPSQQRARIPLARAMQLTAQRGLPGWPKP